MTTRLLLVDTEIGPMLKLKEALEQTGDFKVSVAANAPGAVEHLGLFYHHAALVAFDLPASDVVEVVRELRTTQPDLIVIVMPGSDSEENRVQYLDVQGSLRKPFTAREAIPTIQRIIAQVRRQAYAPPADTSAPPRAAEPANLFEDASPAEPALNLDALDTSQPHPFQDYHEPDAASILDEFAALEEVQTGPLTPLEMRESSGPQFADDYNAENTRPLDQIDPLRSVSPVSSAERYPQVTSPPDYDQREQPAPSDETREVPFSPRPFEPHGLVPSDIDIEAAAAAEEKLNATYGVDATNWFRDVPEAPDPLAPAGVPHAAPPPPADTPGANITPSTETEAEDAQDLFDAIYSDANYAADVPLMPPDLPGAWQEPDGAPDGEPASEPHSLPGAWQEPTLRAPNPDDTRPLDDAWAAQASQPDNRDKTRYLSDDTTRPLDPTQPFPGLNSPFDELDTSPARDEYEDAILDVLTAIGESAAASRPDDADGSPDNEPNHGVTHDRVFDSLVDSLRASPPDSPRRTALEDLFARLDQEATASSAAPSSAIDSVLNAIRSGTPLPGTPELTDATIGDVIQGLFDSSFEGVLATLAGEPVTDDSFTEPTYESTDQEADRRRRWAQEPPVTAEDSASYPATTALSAVRGAADEPGEFSLDALLRKIEADLPRPHRPYLKPLPSWEQKTHPAEQSHQAGRIEAMFNHIEGVDQGLKGAAPVEDTRFQSLFEEFENLTPESLVPSPLAHESVRDAAPPPELLDESDAADTGDTADTGADYGDPFAIADARLRVEAAEASDEDADAANEAEEQTEEAIDAEEDAVPDLETPSFVDDYALAGLQETDTRPMPIDAGANLDTDYEPPFAEPGYAEPEYTEPEHAEPEYTEPDDEQVIDQYASAHDRITDHIPPDLAAALGELAAQLSDLPHKAPGQPPENLPEWVEHGFDLPPADEEGFVEVPADTAAMILSGLDARGVSTDAPAAEALDVHFEDNAPSTQPAAPTDAAAGVQADTEAPLDRDALAEIAVALTGYALESSAQAVMLAQPGAVVAMSGDLPETAERHLFHLVDAAWNEAPDSGALIRFITLPDAGEFVLYSTLVPTDEAGDLSLSMIFHVDTPVRLIRRQAQRLSESLALIPEDSAPGFGVPDHGVPGHVLDSEPLAAQTLVNRPTELRPPEGLREAIQVQPPAGAPAVSIPERPADDSATYTAYTCAWLPADPALELRGRLADALAGWLDDIAQANAWEIQDCQVGPEIMLLTLRVPDKLLADSVIMQVMDDTTARCAEQFPEVVAEDATLWTDGYYLVAPPRALSDREIGRFITAQRHAQNRE